MRSGSIALSALLLGISFICSCDSSMPVSGSELPGLYVIQSGSVTDSIRLEPNGRFEHHLWDDSGLAISEIGTWTRSHYPDGDFAVDFSGISPFADRSAPHVSHPGFWLTRVGRTRNGQVTLMLNRDLNLVYSRKD